MQKSEIHLKFVPKSRLLPLHVLWWSQPPLPPWLCWQSWTRPCVSGTAKRGSICRVRRWWPLHRKWSLLGLRTRNRISFRLYLNGKINFILINEDDKPATTCPVRSTSIAELIATSLLCCMIVDTALVKPALPNTKFEKIIFSWIFWLCHQTH